MLLSALISIRADNNLPNNYPYLWKTNKSDVDYLESWGDPKVQKAQTTERKTNKQKSISNDLKKRNGRGI